MCKVGGLSLFNTLDTNVKCLSQGRAGLVTIGPNGIKGTHIEWKKDTLKDTSYKVDTIEDVITLIQLNKGNKGTQVDKLKHGYIVKIKK